MVRVALLAALLCVQATAAAAQARLYRIDPERTTVAFSVRAGFDRVDGRIPRVEGEVVHDPTRPAAARVEAAAPLAGLTTGDPGLDRMLQAPDWFDAARRPTLRFVSESAAAEGRSARIRGRLTLRGVTAPVELVSTARDEADGTVRFVAETEIDRRRFGMTRMTGLVGDRVKVRVEGVALPTG
jgi:polyisoprenoid-binding protein YceI